MNNIKYFNHIKTLLKITNPILPDPTQLDSISRMRSENLKYEHFKVKSIHYTSPPYSPEQPLNCNPNNLLIAITKMSVIQARSPGWQPLLFRFPSFKSPQRPHPGTFRLDWTTWSGRGGFGAPPPDVAPDLRSFIIKFIARVYGLSCRCR